MGLEQRLDDAEVGAFLRQLEDLEQQADRIEFPDLPFANGDIVPLDIKNDPWAQYTTYRQITHIGQWKHARNYSTDIPLVDFLYQEFRQKIHKWVSGYSWTDDDVAAVARMGDSLDNEKVFAVNESGRQTLNKLIAFGDPDLNMPGFINHPDALRSLALYPLNANSTALEQLKTLNNAVNSVVKLTKQVEKPDTLLLPLEERDYLSNSLIQIGSTALNKTVLQHFLETNGYIKNIEVLNELSKDALTEAGVGTKSCMIAYRRDPGKVKAKIYQSITFKEARRAGADGWVKPAIMKYGGIQLRRPYSMHVVELPE
jgi:hypothetical protein